MTADEQLIRLADYIRTEFPDYITADGRIDDIAINIMTDYKDMLAIEWKS